MTPGVFASVWTELREKLKELGWAALLVVLRWLLERWTSGGGSSSRDADSGK